MPLSRPSLPLAVLALLPVLTPVPPAAAQGAGADLPPGAAPPPGLVLDGARLRRDGRTLAEPTGVVMFDAGNYFGDAGPGRRRDGPLDDASTLRRGRLGVTGRPLPDLAYTAIWDFAGVPGDSGYLYEASLRWSGARPFTVVAGVFEPRVNLAYGQSSSDLVFLERGAAGEVGARVGAGSARAGVGVEGAGPRWFGAGYVTAGTTDRFADDRERGAAGRLVVLPVRRDGALVHLGVSAGRTFRTAGDGRTVRFRERADLRVEDGRLVDTGALRADGAGAAGIEAGFGLGRLQGMGEYVRLEADLADGGTRRFAGWYAQGSYTLLGAPRAWQEARGAFGSPKPDRPFAPAEGAFGALEAGLRYSALDLDDGPVRGGRQGIWSAALNWYPAPDLKLMLQLQDGRVTRDGATGGPRRDREFQSVAVRLQVSY